MSVLIYSLKNIVAEMEQIETEGVDIVLNDAESGRNYYLKLNKEDSERVQHDEVFAQQLLNYAKNHHLNRPPPVKSDGNLKTVMQTPKRSDGGNTAMKTCTNVNTVMQTLNRSDDGNTAMQTCTQSSTLLEHSNGSNDAATTADRVHWPYDAVFLLIQSMETNIENMSHPKKRKHVFENVCNDLLSKGFSFTYEQCAQKWKSLERSYKNAKDNKTKTGRSPSRFYFYDQMDNILGNKPTNSSEHTLESSEDPNENAAIEVEGIDVIDSDTTEKLEKKKLEIEEKKIKVLEDLANKL
ncbi:uncharacterized protein LOC108915337 [Anoplophora glabripennis]|uniref:uncharacterized protein LOC108915337 n=1 Tax=Anoplophora glabripennis TaxID=217634 RepID=UPI0008741E63|nr:uncharacterized protein LOC108915337 [Anoplophora glabripennis]